VREELKDESAESDMKLLQKVIVEVRTIRAENRIPPKQKIELWVKGIEDKGKQFIHRNETYIQSLANIRHIEILDHFPEQKKLLKGIAGSWEIAIPVEDGIIDLQQEQQRLEREFSKIKVETEKLEKRVKNVNFLERAPKEVTLETKRRLSELLSKKTKLEQNLKHILSLVDKG
jgi:valyl-tRNA synthetase